MFAGSSESSAQSPPKGEKMKRIRIGFIGLNPDSHWASTAHIPALKSLQHEFQVYGVANSSPESGQRTAKALNLPQAFATPKDLANSKDIDLVVVTVRVPYHFELVSTALAAGKHVYCEWPLGNGTEEARKLTELAKSKGVVAAVGTQMRTSPDLRFLQKLVADGYVGKVLSSTLVGDGGNWGEETTADLSYLYDKSKGATMLTIPFAHTLAGVQDVLGGFQDITGQTAVRREKVLVTDTGKEIARTAADQVMAQGVFESGAVFSAHYRGGMSLGTNFLWEINGTEGDIQVSGNIGHGQFAELVIRGGREGDKELKVLTPPTSLYEGLPEEVIPRNVAGIYKLIAQDIRTGSRLAPSFEDGLTLHKLLDRIGNS